MRAKNKKFLVTCCALACGSALVVGATAWDDISANAATQTATFVSVNTKNGSDWEGKYGEEGYLILNGANNIYSDMYTSTATGTAIAGTWSGSSYTPTDTSSTLKDTAPISAWGVTSQQHGSSDNNASRALYAPGTTKTAPTRIATHNYGPNDVYFYFTLTEETPIYLTAYFYDFNSNISESSPVTVALYKGNNAHMNAYGDGAKESAAGANATIDECVNYYQGGEPLAKATATTYQNYVTFKIEGEGKYCVALYSNVVQSSSNEWYSKNPSPNLNGIFFDDEVPGTAKPQKAEYVATDSEQGSAWESKYGKDGYLILNGANIYSDMYSKVGTGNAVAGAYTGNGNNWKYVPTDSESILSSDALITDWTIGGQLNQNGTEQSAKAVYAPGTTTNVPTRTNTANYKGNDVYLSFTLNTKTPVYLTTYFYDWSNKVQESTPITASLYQGSTRHHNAYGDGAKETAAGVDATVEQCVTHFQGAEPLATTNVTTQGAYVTYKLEGKGSYTLVLFNPTLDSTVAANAGVIPNLNAIFFDTSEPGLPTAPEHNITYNGVEGATHTNPATYTEGTALPLVDASKAGYTFEGWYDAAEGGNKVEEISAESTTDVELWARFTAIVIPENADMTSRGNWIGKYGSDGYIILASDWDGTATTPQAYTKGIYSIGGENYDGKVAYDKTKFAGGALEFSTLGAVVMRNELVSRYGIYAPTWDNSQAKSWYEPGLYGDELYTPEWTEDIPTTVQTRVGSGAYNYASFAFTIPQSLFAKYEYVDITFYHGFSMNHKVLSDEAEAFSYTTLVYKDYYTHYGDTEMVGRFASQTAIFSDVVPYSYAAGSKDTFHNGFYITYRFTEAGDYTFVNSTDSSNSYKPTLGGVFFDLGDEKPVLPTVSNITYNGVEGATHTNPATYTEGTAVTLTDATKDGYTFDGWYDAAEGGNKVTAISAESTGAVTLWARFTKIVTVSDITYNGVEGATHTNPATYTEGTALTLADATKDGYTFDGWYDAAEGGNKVTEISAERTGDVELWARFTAIDDGGDETPDGGDETPDGGDETPDGGDETPDGGDDKKDNKESGCGSSIAGMSVVGATLAIASAVVACKKRKED